MSATGSSRMGAAGEAAARVGREFADVAREKGGKLIGTDPDIPSDSGIRNLMKLDGPGHQSTSLGSWWFPDIAARKLAVDAFDALHPDRSTNYEKIK